jgi:hypothetical protein
LSREANALRDEQQRGAATLDPTTDGGAHGSAGQGIAWRAGN